MKKLILSIVACSFIIAGCNNSPSYKISGSVEDIANGDTVYLQEYKNGEMIKLDSAVVTDGKFYFKGKQDSVVNRYITYLKGDKRFFTDFFLENGNIKIELGQDPKVSGTKDNDIYQNFKNKFMALNHEMNGLYMRMQTDTSMSQIDKEKIITELENKDKEGMGMVFNTIKENINNAVGIYLLPQYASAFSIKQQAELINAVPAKYMNNETLKTLKSKVELAMKTAVGEKYINFTMDTSDGNKASLSDYVSANKYTLLDFWASWCGPCRAEMPNVIAAYNMFKDKGFGIVGISLDEDMQDWKDAIAAFDITWPQMSDLKGWNNAAAKIYGIKNIPATILINQEGIIVARNIKGEAIIAELDKLYKEDALAQEPTPVNE